MDAIARSGFDYGDLAEAHVAECEHIAEEVVHIGRRIGENMLELGRTLKAAHERLANQGNGTFGKWVTSRCGMSRHYANRFIQAFETFGGGDTSLVISHFDRTAVLALSAPSVPKIAREEAVKTASEGTPVTHKMAQAIIKKHAAVASVPPVETIPALKRPPKLSSHRVPEKRGYYWATHKVLGRTLIVLLSRDGKGHLRVYVAKKRRSYDPTDFGDYSERIPSPRRKKKSRRNSQGKAVVR